MFEIKMTADEIIQGLRETYGKTFTWNAGAANPTGTRS